MVSIVLENCEAYQFKDSDVDVYLDGLYRHFYSGSEYQGAQDVMIRIGQKAEGKPENELSERDWKERFQLGDITQIEINGETYFVPWGGDDFGVPVEVNPYQKSHRSHYGDYIYIISKTRYKEEDFK